mmetsp:Transcript_4781/g.16736  ORF Transcript_4781/g.16736 Transcript_4781/m.16736 type:complete len:327 (+) Transcript_4781:189-1169(+)
MRFKGVLTQRGLNELGRGFLPTLQRFGKTVVLVLGPEEVHLVSEGGMASDADSTDGPFVCVRLGAPLVFDAAPLCQSKHNLNLIAFEFDLKLFERVMHGAASNEAEGLEMKLSMRRVPNGEETQARPFLSFQQGGSISITSELPISKPFPQAEVDHLIALIRSDDVCPFYVDLMPAVANLNESLKRLKKLSQACLVTLVKNGDAHFQAFRMQSGCTVGVEYRGLEVHPDGERVADDRNVEAQQQPTGRLAAAKDLGMCSELIVRAKHLTSAFGVCQYTRPAKLLCGANGDFLHFLYVYLDRAGGAVTDKESMAIKIPCVQDSSAGF